MTAVLCTSTNVVYYAGVNAKVLADAQYTAFIEEAQDQLVADTGLNLITAWPTISANPIAATARSAVAAKAAVNVISYDPYSVGDIAGSTTVINVNLDVYDRAVKQLKDANVYGPLGAAKLTT